MQIGVNMGTLTIREYDKVGIDPRATIGSGGAFIQVAQEPAIASQMITTGASSVATVDALNDRTILVRLSSDVNEWVEFGVAPVAAPGGLDLIAGVPEYVSVIRESGLKVAAVNK